MSNESIEDKIVELYNERKWNDIVNLNASLNCVEKCRLFWVLPTANDFSWMKGIIDKYSKTGLTSIGCGCGLFEWLFQEYTGLDVIGIELDRSWWRSKYSPPLFLENMIFINENDMESFDIPEKHAALFCYFNNETAFCNYITNYKGNLIFVIGPKGGENRWTDPLPFDKKFDKYGWSLISKKEIDRSNDYITAYSR